MRTVTESLSFYHHVKLIKATLWHPVIWCCAVVRIFIIFCYWQINLSYKRANMIFKCVYSYVKHVEFSHRPMNQ